MKKLLFPSKLSKNDKAVIISPSGSTDRVYIDGAKSVLESWGLVVEVAENAYCKHGRFGGTVEQRLSDLQSAMDDEKTRLIFCSRGGYGIVQLLDRLDFTRIREYPKWLVGYSDITALHLAFLQNGIASVHAPMARHLTENMTDAATDYLREVLFSRFVDYTIHPHSLNTTSKVRGRLFGGNLAVLCSLVGTVYMKNISGKILFIEDIAESPYKIDRMMWQLKLSGVLGKIAGLVVGQFTECEEDPLMGRTIYESIKDMVAEYGYPVAFDCPVGHVDDNYPLVCGEKIQLDVDKNKVTIQNIN